MSAERSPAQLAAIEGMRKLVLNATLDQWASASVTDEEEAAAKFAASFFDEMFPIPDAAIVMRDDR